MTSEDLGRETCTLLYNRYKYALPRRTATLDRDVHALKRGCDAIGVQKLHSRPDGYQGCGRDGLLDRSVHTVPQRCV
jgi:HPt (histidine-containing phosphotransfer) domain-containing protein